MRLDDGFRWSSFLLSEIHLLLSTKIHGLKRSLVLCLFCVFFLRILCKEKKKTYHIMFSRVAMCASLLDTAKAETCKTAFTNKFLSYKKLCLLLTFNLMNPLAGQKP